jgi:hypothetical protein
MILDPPPAPEQSENLVRAADLKNRVLLLRPTGLGEWPAKDDGKGPQPYVECDVWLLDRAGVESHATGVRFSWWRAVAQLTDCMDRFVACRPVERDDRSVELQPLTGSAREVAEKVADELAAGADTPAETPADIRPAGYASGEEPF